MHFNWIFPYKPSILGYPHLWKPPFLGTENRAREKSHALRGKSTEECPAIKKPEGKNHRPKHFLILWLFSICSMCALKNVEKWRNEEMAMAGTHSVIQAQHGSTLLHVPLSFLPSRLQSS